MQGLEKIDPVRVGRRLEALRSALDMPQNDFSAVIGVDPSSYTKIKKGAKPLHSDMAYRVSLRFGVSMDYLYKGDVSSLPESLRQAVLASLGGQTR